MIFEPQQKFNLKFIVSHDIHQGFIQNFKDENPLHTDEEFAQQKGFKGKVMHGVFESVNTVEFKFSFKNLQDKTVAKGKIQIGILI